MAARIKKNAILKSADIETKEFLIVRWQFLLTSVGQVTIIVLSL